MTKLSRPLKVALINSTLPDRFCSYGDHWECGFKDAGFDVTVFPYDNISLIPPCFDLYFFVEIRYQMTSIPWYLNPRVLYSWDSHVTGIDIFKEAASHFDQVLLASKIDVNDLKTQRTNNVLWIPEACNPRIHKNLHMERFRQIGYVGRTNNYIIRNNKTKG